MKKFIFVQVLALVCSPCYGLEKAITKAQVMDAAYGLTYTPKPVVVKPSIKQQIISARKPICINGHCSGIYRNKSDLIAKIHSDIERHRIEDHGRSFKPHTTITRNCKK
jgi:hypothetical protein